MARQLYTARYANKWLSTHPGVKVPISLGLPRFPIKYPLEKRILQLAPTWRMLNMARELYEVEYRRRLDLLGIGKVNGLLDEYGHGPITLLCFEDLRRGEWCHRRMFAEWYKEQTGEPVEELDEDGGQLSLL